MPSKTKPQQAPAAAKPTTGSARGLSLEVHNFGPIAEGMVDVRPLTVFAGPSNTGKSWMATLIYALSRYLSELPSRFRYYGFEKVEREKPLLPSMPKLKMPENPKAWLDSVRKQGQIAQTDSDLEQWHAAIQAFENRGGLAAGFLRWRGLPASAGLTRTHAPEKMSARFRCGHMGGHLEILPKGKKNSSASSTFRIDLPRQLNLSEEQAQWMVQHLEALPPLHAPGSGMARQIFLEHLARFLVVNNFAADAGYPGSFFYLPEGRGILTNTLSALTSGLIDRASRPDVQSDKLLPRLSGVASDFLQMLQLAHMKSEVEADGVNLTSKIESRILGGEVKVEQSEVGMPIFNFHPAGWKGQYLPLVGTSSMVSELAPVALFLRYWIRPGDTLILEEPEAHLHPAAQMRLTEEIAAWVKAGIRVIITTHSEWMLETLSNMVYRSQVKESDRKGKPALAKEEVGVWLFDFINPGKPREGTRITEIPWSLDEAGYEAGFYDAAMKGDNDWSESWNCIANGGEEK